MVCRLLGCVVGKSIREKGSFLVLVLFSMKIWKYLVLEVIQL